MVDDTNQQRDILIDVFASIISVLVIVTLLLLIVAKIVYNRLRPPWLITLFPVLFQLNLDEAIFLLITMNIIKINTSIMKFYQSIMNIIFFKRFTT